MFVVGNLRGSSRPEVFPIRNFSTTTLRELTKGVSGGYGVYTTDCAKTLKCLGGGLGAKTGLYAVAIERGVLKRKPVVTTLDANYYKGLDKHQARTGIMEGMKIRRLTPTECERLQGFPDGWTESISDTQRYKCLGNAVTVNVVEYIIKKLK